MGPPHVGDGRQADFEKGDVTTTLYEFVFVLAKFHVTFHPPDPSNRSLYCHPLF
jgi:hypothetical protein